MNVLEDYDDVTEAFDDESYGGFDDEAAPSSRLRWRPRARAPLPPVSSTGTATGVDRATLRTPRGDAQLQLPAKVVTIEEFRKETARIEGMMNQTNTRLNTIQTEVNSLGTRLTSIVSANQQDITKLRKESRYGLARLRRQQSSQAMTSMMMGLILQQQQQSQFDSHTHAVTGAVTGTPVTSDGSNNSALVLLPMMMMMSPGDSGSGYGESGPRGESAYGSDGDGNNSMMMMMMMMMLVLNQSSNKK